MTKIQPITPQYAAIEAPTELRLLRGWLIYRLELSDGADKPLKVPYYANGSRRAGKQGSPEDRAKLTTYALAKAQAADADARLSREKDKYGHLWDRAHSVGGFIDGQAAKVESVLVLFGLSLEGKLRHTG